MFIVGCIDGVIPHKKLDDPMELALEKSVFYVGMTRARDILYMSYADNNGSNRPSPFLSQIEHKCELSTVALSTKTDSRI